ncbi:MAG: TetR/AcrR family transcriptional regulator [Actinomycetota bacterium]
MAAETADRIVVATNELFRRQGYNGTSLSQISKASEATIGSIYHFFPGGKEALAVAVIDTTGSVYRELFESIADAADDLATGFQDVFTGAAAVLEETDFIDPCPIGTVAREAANTNEPLRAAADRAFDSWVDAAAGRLRALGVDERGAKELATMFVATLEGCFVLSRTKRSTEPLRVAGRHVADLAARAIAAADPARADG